MPATTLPRALVTGATSGIGRATAIQLARDGFEILAHGRDADRGRSVIDAIVTAGGRGKFIAGDLSDMPFLRKLADEARDVDVLVNNAGIAIFSPTPDLPADQFDAQFATNVRAPYYLVAAIAPRMAARGKGSIVNVSSVVSTVGFPGTAAYSATKGAVDSLTRAWAAEYSPKGVRVNAVAPGPIYTAVADREVIAAFGESTLLKRAGNDAEIAAVISFLASERSSYLTGSVIAADGGRGAI
jgi:NAD(P)-dependent dehydrogenase (short-subunit alcohol dehydrogenase family)